MKKLLILCVLLVCICLLSACAGGSTTPVTESPDPITAEAPISEPAAELTAEPAPEPTAEPVPEPTPEPIPESTPEPTAEPTPVPTPTSYELGTIAVQGSCGKNVNWALDNKGLLLISGSGPMGDEDEDWYGFEAPWEDRSSAIRTVVIEPGVTSVGSLAFYYCSNLTKVVIPESVNSIGPGAFMACLGLTELTIPAGVTEIGEEAFFGCFSLETIEVAADTPAFCSVDGVLFDKAQTVLVACPGAKSGDYQIPDSVSEIKGYAFAGCRALKKITIPDSVTEIGESVFAGCNGLKTIEAAADNPAFCSADGVLYDKAKTTLIAYPAGVKGDFIIPEGVTEIGKYAFMNAQLTKIFFSDSVTKIGAYAFQGCRNLIKVQWSDNLRVIGPGAFSYCSSLKSITIPSGVTNVDSEAFAHCGSVRTVTIQEGITEINCLAFSNMSNLTSISIPASVEWFVWNFADCPNLQSIIVSEDNPRFQSIGNAVFDKEMTTLVLCAGGAAGKYRVPDGITTIGYSAFESASKLTGVTIPTSVTTIESMAFFSCSGLSDVYYMGSEEQWAQIEIEEYNEDLQAATIHFNSEG